MNIGGRERLERKGPNRNIVEKPQFSLVAKSCLQQIVDFAKDYHRNDDRSTLGCKDVAKAGVMLIVGVVETVNRA